MVNLKRKFRISKKENVNLKSQKAERKRKKFASELQELLIENDFSSQSVRYKFTEIS